MKMTGEEAEKEKQMKEAKESALKNLKGNYPNLAAAYFVEKSGQYGEAGASAVDQFIYLPAVKDKEGSELVYGSLLGSRQGGRRYSGNVSEWYIIEKSAEILQESLSLLNVQDVLNLMGSKAEIKEEYKNKQLAELAQSENKEEKDIFQKVFGSYMGYLTDMKVSEALSKMAKSKKSNLEELVK